MTRRTLDETLTAAERQTFGERLLRLEAYLADLPVRAYNHSSFITERNECGTVACALGHAVTSKLFPDLPIWVIRTSDGWNLDTVRSTHFLDVTDKYFGPRAYSEIFASHAYPLVARPGLRSVRTRLREIAAKRYGVVA